VVSDWLPSPSGHGGGDTGNPMMGGPPLGCLASDLGARFLVGRPWSLTWILVVRRSPSRGGDICIGKISIGSSSSSSISYWSKEKLRHGSQLWMAHGSPQRSLRELAGSEGSINQ
jgi:hypothetical protein